VFYELDPLRDGSREPARTAWSPSLTGDWELSPDGLSPMNQEIVEWAAKHRPALDIFPRTETSGRPLEHIIPPDTQSRSVSAWTIFCRYR